MNVYMFQKIQGMLILDQETHLMALSICFQQALNLYLTFNKLNLAQVIKSFLNVSTYQYASNEPSTTSNT